MGDFEGAVADFSSAVALDPRNADFYHNRGFSLRKQVSSNHCTIAWHMPDTCHMSACQWRQAAIILHCATGKSVAVLYPTIKVYQPRCVPHMQGRFEAAIKDYTMAVALNPGHCRAYYNRAFSHDRLGQFEEAVADYSKALQIEPSNATALHNRGSLFERLGRYVTNLSATLDSSHHEVVTAENFHH